MGEPIYAFRRLWWADCDELIEFDLSAITPSNIRNVRKGCPSKALQKMGSHTTIWWSYLLLNIFWQPCSQRSYWRTMLPQNHGKIKLIPKSEDLSKPENFRPIALTSAVGKLFNKILALRLEHFLRSNDIIHTSLQKVFGPTSMAPWNISSQLQRSSKMQFRMASLSQSPWPQDCFWVSTHQLIYNMVVHIQLPFEVRLYISSAYSQLSARVVTKNWSTPSFPVSRGVFQGDTLSPLIFLITFNPIIQLAQSLSTCGFQLKLSDPHHTTKQLGKAPPHDSCICKAHQIECKRKYSKHEYTLRWVTAMSQEKTDLAVTWCIHHICTATSTEVKLITPSFVAIDNLEAALNVISTPDHPFLLCAQHYQEVYRQFKVHSHVQVVESNHGSEQTHEVTARVLHIREWGTSTSSASWCTVLIPTPVHTLLLDTIEMCGGSRVLIRILNQLEAVASYITVLLYGRREDPFPKCIYETFFTVHFQYSIFLFPFTAQCFLCKHMTNDRSPKL